MGVFLAGEVLEGVVVRKWGLVSGGLARTIRFLEGIEYLQRSGSGPHSSTPIHQHNALKTTKVEVRSLRFFRVDTAEVLHRSTSFKWREQVALAGVSMGRLGLPPAWQNVADAGLNTLYFRSV